MRCSRPGSKRWWPDLLTGLIPLYGAQRAPLLAAELVGLASAAYVARSDRLHVRDIERMLRPDWLQDPAMVGYAAYTERFGGHLRGVTGHLPYLAELGVTYLHLMPLLRPREGDNDGGYAVADYRSVRPDLGTMDDLEALAESLHGAGMSLVLDLVLNHVAREHDWAARARAGDPAYREYFHVFPDRTVPDAYELTLPEVFPDFAPGNFTWDDDLDGWVWTTFNEFQWDVNWANPAVLREYASTILDLANRGVDVLRLDAIAFMWKRLGTDCQGQPEVHAITQVLRAVTRIACPAVAFLAEAIVAPTKLLDYLGTGSYSGKVSDLAYHNSLMVQVWSMLAARDVRLAVQALGALPPKPPSATWLTYLRCHDDIGWAIMDEDAAALGMNGHAHRSFLAHWYAGDFRVVRRGRGVPAQPRHRRPPHEAGARPRSSDSRPPAPRGGGPRGLGAAARARPRHRLGRYSPSSGAATSWASPTTPTGRRSRGTRRTTGGPTDPASTGPGPRSGTTPRRWRVACSATS